jgi:hypothetical protein
MAAKAKVIQGNALWAKVFEPDTKFDPNGTYSIQVTIPEEEAAGICEYLDKVVQDRFDEEVKAKPKMKNSLSTKAAYEPHYDKDGNETGLVEFRFKLKAKVQTRDGSLYDQKPIVVDAKRNPMDSNNLIGNGSIVKVAFEPIPYVMASTKQVGVSLRLKGVQVIELVEYGNGGASMFDEEEGFVAEKMEMATSPFDDGMDDTDESEGDF